MTLTLITEPEQNHILQARWQEVAHVLRPMGFEVGWGDTVGRVTESMRELLDILQAHPSRLALLSPLSRICFPRKTSFQ